MYMTAGRENQSPIINLRAPATSIGMQAEQFFRIGIFGDGDGLSGALPMQETDKQYYTRRGKEERKRARSAASRKSQSIHQDLADLCHEKANGSANMNGKSGIRPPDSAIEE